MKANTSFPLIPLKEIVIFPFSITPLYIMRKSSMAALKAAMDGDRRVFLATQRNVQVENPGENDLYEYGVAAEIIQTIELPDNSAKVLIEGHFVARITDYEANGEDEPYVRVCVKPQRVPTAKGKNVLALVRAVVKQFETYANLSDRVPEDVMVNLRETDDPLHTAHFIANYTGLKTAQKQAVLEGKTLSQKFLRLSQLLDQENELLTLESKILNQVKNSISKSQKEYFLNEQLKIIEKELGMASEDDLELDELQDEIERAALPEEAREKAEKELARLSRMQPLSPEATVSRTYIEWILDMPWGKRTRDRRDIQRAQKVLDDDHYGLEKPKERITEFLAVHQLVKEMKSPILCFVGPPGVGKTSLARSVARALGRKFVRVSLGGVRDEAEIRGHRRTYIGSLPGKVIQSIKKAGSMNPVFLMDEIDKMSMDFRGDPSSALLEVLDPEQNKAFNDHYLEIDFDLSKVMFITTANSSDGIPHALIDRMETIRLSGYTEDEKREIAKRFLLPKQIKENGLTRRHLAFSDETLDLLITGYTREAGVRQLERRIAHVCRKTAKALIDSRAAKTPQGKLQITDKVLHAFLGPRTHRDPVFDHDTGQIGVATGLAWTEVGGELLPAETMIMKGKGQLMLTGKLGEVMQESAKAALSYVRARSSSLKIRSDFYKNTDIHIHLPEGAIPKDGPSAGVTMTASLVSALSNQPVRQDVAMTGEITLRGKVLKIGGLKEKVLAAHRAHIHTVIMPEENRDELEEIAEPIRKMMNFIMVNNIDELLDAALLKKRAKRATVRKAGVRRAVKAVKRPKK